MAWELACVPKNEGSLGLIRVENWNKASIMRHI